MGLWPNPAQFFFYLGGKSKLGIHGKLSWQLQCTVPNAQHIEFINFIVPYLPSTYYNQENTHLFVL